MSLYLFDAGSIFTFFGRKISRKTPKKTFIPLKLNTLLLIFFYGIIYINKISSKKG